MNTLTTRWDPYRNLAGMQDELERLFGRPAASPATAGAFSPALDVEETEDEFTLYVELPGVRPDEVEITLEESVLIIAGEREFYGESKADSMRRIERSFGRFHRAVRLPDRVDGDRVTADFKDGILTVAVPKAEDAKPRRISISSAA